jgi:4-amino-4-deoxy-L-arabinose transferase
LARDRRIWLLLLYFIALLAPLGAVSAVESTEARYAEAGREMIVSGDYLQPRINGIKHFHKPPLAYWMTAAGMRLFGLNGFGMRFFCVVAACLSVLYVRETARILLGDDRRAFHAALVFSTSLLILTLARVSSTEIYLVLFTLAAQFHMFRGVYGEKRPCDAPMAGLFLGLGFLTKGHIVFAFTLLPYLAAKAVDESHRSVFRTRELLAGAAVFLAVALPWYLLVIAENPGLLPYFLKVQTVDRIATDRFLRHQPFWYFLWIFPATFLPYVLFLVRGAASLPRLRAPVRILFLFYLLLPFLVFSAVKGKHATYIAPMYGAAAVFTAEAIAAFPSPALRWISAGILALLAAAPAAAGFLLPALNGVRLPLAASSAVALPMAWMAARRPSDDRFLQWTAGCLLLLSVAGWGAYSLTSRRTSAYETMTAEFNRIDTDRGLDVLVYRGNLPSISFYRGKLATMAFGGERETQFEKDDRWKDVYIQDEESLKAYLSVRPELFAVVPPAHADSFPAEHALSCEELYRAKRFNAYLCRKR